jgi:hypothetical protein
MKASEILLLCTERRPHERAHSRAEHLSTEGDGAFCSVNISSCEIMTVSDGLYEECVRGRKHTPRCVRSEGDRG